MLSRDVEKRCAVWFGMEGEEAKIWLKMGVFMDEIETAGRLSSCPVTIANYCVDSCDCGLHKFTRPKIDPTIAAA